MATAGAGQGIKVYLSAPHGCYGRDAVKVYLAGMSGERARAREAIDRAADDLMVDGVPGLCVLESFYYVADWMRPYIRGRWDFLLDSGAFTFMRGASTAAGVDWPGYIDRYAEFIVDNHVDKFFELDIDSVVGLAEVRRLRGRLESRTGRRCIPVWHRARGLDNWRAITRDYDYVAIGGLVTKEIKKSEYGVFRALCDIARDNGARVHALGFTPLDGTLASYGFYSTDSTAWLAGNLGGYLYSFDGRTMTKIPRPPGTKIKAKAVAMHNFNEWVKFQNHMRGFR